MNLTDSIRKLLKNKYVLIIPAGIMLILSLRSLVLTQTDKTEESSPPTGTSVDDFSAELEDILSEIKGVKNAKVLLSCAGGTQYIFAEDLTETQNQDKKTTTRKTVIAGGDAVVRGTAFPEITGAVVVYTGVNSATVKLQLFEAVQAATGLASNKITVLPG